MVTLSNMDKTIVKKLASKGHDHDAISKILGIPKTAVSQVLPDPKKVAKAKSMFEAGVPLKDIAQTVGAKSHLTISSWAKKGEWDISKRSAPKKSTKRGRGKGRLPRNARMKKQVLAKAGQTAVDLYNSDTTMSSGLAIVKAAAFHELSNINAVRDAAQQVPGSPFRTRK